VLLKGLTDELQVKKIRSSAFTPFYQTPILKLLKQLPEKISLETKDKIQMETLFKKVGLWLASEDCNLADKANWIKLITAVNKLQATQACEESLCH